MIQFQPILNVKMAQEAQSNVVDLKESATAKMLF
jgi:hypothetical protein